ncbi:E3 ubiquitin-protein ligase MARCHF8-like isoform X2 [Pararge aegeria]|uniref:E3 ubiquitin-protein ligase MARCHF8-like isoform X2 n=1 Tax=Pararge aegeria TaxID=116150 RepID=UPI0019D03DF5|nr:E3 ubiquitin-protein ligase MARCHF8-like isoform X2 [Pararge aegeria]
MDDQEKSEVTEEKSSHEENIIGKKLVNNAIVQTQNDAGPSGIINLPGAIPLSPRSNFRTGLSKSEHSIRQIITRQDVADALKLTSLSISKANQPKNVKMNEIKIPILEKFENKADDSITYNELKKFMASCFKLNKTEPTSVNENSSVSVIAAINTIANDLVQNVPNVSLITDKKSVNEAVTKNGPKQNKTPEDSNKNKSSGNASERSNLEVVQRDSLSSIGSNVCRICMTRGKERLISPCNCKGSLANVHLSCLQRWLNQVGRNHCELCGFSYPAIRTPRYTVLQALRLWFCNPRNRSHLQSDCLIFWLLSTVTAGLMAVCIVGTQYFVIEGNNFGISHRITETAMDFFMAIVLCGYSVTVYFLWKDHYVMWNRWRRANVNVQLLLTPDANPVPFVPRSRYNVV